MHVRWRHGLPGLDVGNRGSKAVDCRFEAISPNSGRGAGVVGACANPSGRTWDDFICCEIAW